MGRWGTLYPYRRLGTIGTSESGMAGDQRSGGRGEPCSDRFIDQSPADTHDGVIVTAPMR
jgi:hypothetical protein